jgi:hypothetical protein
MGARPRIAIPVFVLLGVACSTGSADQTVGPLALGMTDQTPAYYSDANLTMYEVQKPIALPVRAPTDAEQGALAATPNGTYYPNAPWLKVQDESVEVHYTLSNIDDTDHSVWLLIDPWNEFVRWNPGVTVVSDEQTTPNWGYDLYLTVPAKSRLEGTLTTDDMREIAIKLATVENFLASPAGQTPTSDAGMMDNSLSATGIADNIFIPQNRSNGDNDPLYTSRIPPVIAGLTGFDLGLRYMNSMDGGPVMGGANLAIEITITVQDLNGNRFVKADSTDPQLGPPPTTLSPPGARF